MIELSDAYALVATLRRFPQLRPRTAAGLMGLDYDRLMSRIRRQAQIAPFIAEAVGVIEATLSRPGSEAYQRASVEIAWTYACELAALRWGVDPALLMAPSRGRGPRPPREVWEPKKVALFLVFTVGCGCISDIAKAAGLHKDTAHTHIRALEAERAEDDTLDAMLEQLETELINRLEAPATKVAA